MAKKTSLDLQKSFEKAFDYFNRKLFKGSLPSPMLILSNNKNIMNGNFKPNQYFKEDVTIHEISISINLMGSSTDRNIKRLYIALIRQMLHLWQYENGKPTGNNYHNKEWINKAKEIGFDVKGRGYSKLTLSIKKDTRLDSIMQSIPEDAVFIIKADKKKAVVKRHQSSGKRKKYVCPKCNIAVWGKGGLKIGCLDCKVDLEV